ncbi:hypothetical protein GWC77_18620 [Paraburkholderia sp. NMBU_R16]|uniref:L-histidine N(alpha)-methyltransferase n=1 Tax=Paraburkholderia sp. NMBU_R16 TaxID=2698676 RepID=UPI00156650A8|nr:L-histidine N(alpha)-methyltransferase [Paraburkholderia sp. NMBU_R16]NRO97941.1 hypothetical protein [Paraburkholderia sp. NMBU_R16]
MSRMDEDFAPGECSPLYASTRYAVVLDAAATELPFTKWRDAMTPSPGWLDHAVVPCFHHHDPVLPGGPGSGTSGGSASARKPSTVNAALDALRTPGVADGASASFKAGAGSDDQSLSGRAGDSVDALRRRIADSIVYRDGIHVLPVNVAYLTPAGAEKWVVASKDPKYALPRAELALVKAFVEEWDGHIGAIREFGPGDGCKAAEIIKSFGQPAPEYTGVDVNPALLEKAKSTLSALQRARPELKLKFDSLDLEDPHSIGEAQRPVPHRDGLTVGMLLGQTLGNPDHPAIMLKNIQSRLPLDGRLLVGVALIPEQEAAMERTLVGYRATAYQEHILASVKQLGLAHAGRLQIVWDAERHSVVGYFKFDRNVKVPGTQLEFARGDRMQVFYSHRFTEGEMTALLNSTGFDDVRIKKSESFPYAVIGARVAGDARAA